MPRLWGRDYISIHVPRVEDDQKELDELKDYKEFQSTSPVWRTTKAEESDTKIEVISIHVPRVEDDIVRRFDFA